MKLADYGEALAYEVAFWMQGVFDPNYPIGQLGKLSIEVSEKLRALAVITLLVKAESDFFHHNLIRSGRSRLAYLQRTRREGIEADHFRSSGWCDSLMDAIAAGDLDLARQIDSFSPGEFRDGHEYEDDYCCAQILQRFIRKPCPEDEIPPLLARLEAYLDGKANGRFDVMKSLAEKNQAEFDAAFASLLLERDVRVAVDKERGQLEEPHIVAQRLVFVEGLSFLRLAEFRGLTTEPEYQFCPLLARAPMTTPFPGE